MGPSKIQTLRQEHDVRAAFGGLGDPRVGAREIPGRLAGLDEHLCQDQFHGSRADCTGWGLIVSRGSRARAL